MAAPIASMEELHLHESPEEDPWHTNAKQHPHSTAKVGDDTSGAQPPSSIEDRESALRAELHMLRDINKVIEGTIDSLERAKSNVGTVSHTVSSASLLLDTWTRILSQTEQNQRLILNPSWQGATQDIADIESEAVLKQQAAEQKELELQQQREALARKTAEEERRRADAASATSRGSRISSRGRTRVMGRNTSVSSGVQSGSTASRGSTRGTVARGTTGLRRPSSTATRGSGVASSRGRLRET